MTKFNPTPARLRLQHHLKAMRSDPKQAGNVARIELSLEMDPKWPFSAERFAEVCRELGMKP